jgi:hypothetical protein
MVAFVKSLFPIRHFDRRPLVIPSPTLSQNGSIPRPFFPPPLETETSPRPFFSWLVNVPPSPSQNGNIPPSLFLMACQRPSVPFSKRKHPSVPFSHGLSTSLRPLLKMETSLHPFFSWLFNIPPSPSQNGNVPPSLFLMACQHPSVPFPNTTFLPFMLPPPPPACLQMI